MEIPTYPYDQEYKGLPLPYQRILFFDKCFRKQLARYVDKIVTFSDHEQIWGRPTIKISNGIDFSQIRVKQPSPPHTDLRLIAVATIHPWHGFDRAIEGLALYYQKRSDQKGLSTHHRFSSSRSTVAIPAICTEKQIGTLRVLPRAALWRGIGQDVR